MASTVQKLPWLRSTFADKQKTRPQVALELDYFLRIWFLAVKILAATHMHLSPLYTRNQLTPLTLLTPLSLALSFHSLPVKCLQNSWGDLQSVISKKFFLGNFYYCEKLNRDRFLYMLSSINNNHSHTKWVNTLHRRVPDT